MMVRHNRERSGNCYKVRLMLLLLGLARIAQLRSYLPIPAYDGAGGPLVE